MVRYLFYTIGDLTCQSPLVPYSHEVEGKDEGHPRTSEEGPEGELKYSSSPSLTSALDGVGGQRHAPAALPRERDQLPIV